MFEFWLCHSLIKWSWACWFLAISFSSLKWEKSQHLQTVERIEWDNVCPVPKTGCVKRRYKINVNFLSPFPRLKTSLKECRHVCSKKKKSVYWIKLERTQPEMEINSTYECGHSENWNEIHFSMKPVLSTERKGKGMTVLLMYFLFLYLLLCLHLSNTKEEKWFGVV